MNKKIQRMKALIIKDVRSNLRNNSMVFLSLLPLIFTILYCTMSFNGEKMRSETVFSMGILMNTCMFPLSSMSIIIAEEKEKQTLRTLMLSTVTAGEFLISKSLFVYTFSQFVSILIWSITKVQIDFSWFFGVSSITVFVIMLIGASVGLIAKSQMSTSLFYMPLMMLFLIPSILANSNVVISKIARLTPTNAMSSLLITGINGIDTLVLGVWLVLCISIFFLVYGKMRID